MPFLISISFVYTASPISSTNIPISYPSKSSRGIVAVFIKSLKTLAYAIANPVTIPA